MPTSNTPQKYVALFDLHYGFEWTPGRHKRAIHDLRALKVALKFIKDFQPDHIILGGDMLDCGPISTHRKREGVGRTEGFRLLGDARGLRAVLLDPLEATKANLTYLIGNHEDWLNQFVSHNPALEGIVDLQSILQLEDRWRVIPQGGHFNLGKLTFIHGDQLGGEFAAKAAVVAYERSIRFGHFHSYQAYTKNSAVDIKQPKTGVCVPCLSSKGPVWVKSKPNRWSQGFNYGYVFHNGTFNDYTPIITHGQAAIEGRVYKGT